MLKIILWQLLAVAALALVGNPIWSSATTIKSGKSVFVTGPYSTFSATFTDSYASPFSATTLRLICGIIDFEISSPAGLYLSLQGQFSTIGASSYTYTIFLFDGTTINSFKSSYFCFDYTVHPYLAVLPSSGTYASGTQVFSGSGYRQTATNINFATPIDTTHTVNLCPFIFSMRIYRPATTDDFVIKARLEVINSTAYRKVVSTNGNCQIYQTSINRVIYDLTALQATQTSYLDLTFFTGISGVSDPFNLVFSDPSNFVAGFNHFVFSGSGPSPKFSFDPVTFMLTSPGYLLINLTTINYRQRTCAPSTPYFLESQNLCYDVCPNPYFPDETNKFCVSCTAGCASCTNSTQCTSCQLRQYRAATPSPLCPCLPLFYENAAKQCVACPNDRACATCALVSGSTNPGGIDCLSCSCAQHRTKSGGNCSCDTGYTTDNSVANAPYCIRV